MKLSKVTNVSMLKNLCETFSCKNIIGDTCVKTIFLGRIHLVVTANTERHL